MEEVQEWRIAIFCFIEILYFILCNTAVLWQSLPKGIQPWIRIMKKKIRQMVHKREPLNISDFEPGVENLTGCYYFPLLSPVRASYTYVMVNNFFYIVEIKRNISGQVTLFQPISAFQQFPIKPIRFISIF